MRRQNVRPVVMFMVGIFPCFVVGCERDEGTVSIIDESKSPQAAYAVEQLTDTLRQSGYQVVTADAEVTICLRIDGETAVAQGYRIEPGRKGVVVTGGDARGVMYGGLELAERLQLQNALPSKPITGEPFLKRRGIKMNIPLDARTPSFDDSGDAAKHNTPEVWDIDFWYGYLDRLALNRFNALTLWNPHPFPSMIKMEDYPDVALDDVCVHTLIPESIENEWGEPQLVSANILENLKVVKRLTIDEKIAFWRKVMRYAQDRGIDIYYITWNICPNSVAKPVAPFYRTYSVDIWDEEPGKYGVTHQINDPDTVQYYREAVKTFLLTYPDVKGIGVTAGEHMPHKQNEYPVEKWLWETYGLGILDAKKSQPGRTVHFIHRIWNTDIDHILKYWAHYPDPFEFSFKYAKARLYSTPTPPFAKWQIEKAKPSGIKFWWNLRNDDIFVHRWGDPDYVREFLTHFDMASTEGYHMGSDGYVWGREFISKAPETPRELELDKHWYRFMMWGRLGYDPSLDRQFFIRKLADRFPEANVEKLYDAWQTASKIIPQVNRFHWQDWDHMWAVEACLSHRGGFREVFDFVDTPTLQDSGLLNPKQFVQASLANKTVSGTTPLDVAGKLDAYTNDAIQGAEALAASGNSKSLTLTLSDIKGMAWLGRYYAEKIRAAVEIARYQQTGKPEYKDQAVRFMEVALENWKQYAHISESNYHSQYLARTKQLDWSLLTQEVERETEMVREMGVSANGVLDR